MQLLGSVALVAAVHVCRRNRYEMGQGLRGALAVAALSAASCFRVSATRGGPSRFTSTAPSRGASKVTEAAAWITMSQAAEQGAPGLVEREPVACDVAADRVETAGDDVVEVLAELTAQSVEAVVAQDLPARCVPRALGVGRAGRRTTTSHSGTLRSNRSTSAVPRKPVAPVTAIRRPASSSRITGVFLAPGCRRAGTSLRNSAVAAERWEHLGFGGNRFRGLAPQASWHGPARSPWEACSACWAWARPDSRSPSRCYAIPSTWAVSQASRGALALGPAMILSPFMTSHMPRPTYDDSDRWRGP